MTWGAILVRAWRVLYNRLFWRIKPEDDEPELPPALKARPVAFIPLTSSANMNLIWKEGAWRVGGGVPHTACG